MVEIGFLNELLSVPDPERGREVGREGQRELYTVQLKVVSKNIKVIKLM